MDPYSPFSRALGSFYSRALRVVWSCEATWNSRCLLTCDVRSALPFSRPQAAHPSNCPPPGMPCRSASFSPCESRDALSVSVSCLRPVCSPARPFQSSRRYRPRMLASPCPHSLLLAVRRRPPACADSGARCQSAAAGSRRFECLKVVVSWWDGWARDTEGRKIKKRWGV
jgi:hypothetical protein